MGNQETRGNQTIEELSKFKAPKSENECSTCCVSRDPDSIDGSETVDVASVPGVYAGDDQAGSSTLEGMEQSECPGEFSDNSVTRDLHSSDLDNIKTCDVSKVPGKEPVHDELEQQPGLYESDATPNATLVNNNVLQDSPDVPGIEAIDPASGGPLDNFRECSEVCSGESRLENTSIILSAGQPIDEEVENDQNVFVTEKRQNYSAEPIDVKVDETESVISANNLHRPYPNTIDCDSHSYCDVDKVDWNLHTTSSVDQNGLSSNFDIEDVDVTPTQAPTFSDVMRVFTERFGRGDNVDDSNQDASDAETSDSSSNKSLIITNNIIVTKASPFGYLLENRNLVTPANESSLDVSERIDGGSTDSVFADDEYDSTYELFTCKRYRSAEHDTTVLLRCCVNSMVDKSSSEELNINSAQADNVSLGDEIESNGADDSVRHFKKARKQMHDIHEHLHNLRMQLTAIDEQCVLGVDGDCVGFISYSDANVASTD